MALTLPMRENGTGSGDPLAEYQLLKVGPVPSLIFAVVLKIKARTFNKRPSDEEEQTSRGGLGDMERFRRVLRLRCGLHTRHLNNEVVRYPEPHPELTARF